MHCLVWRSNSWFVDAICLCPHLSEGMREQPGISQALIPFMKLHPHDLITPKDPSIITLGAKPHHINILGT